MDFGRGLGRQHHRREGHRARVEPARFVAIDRHPRGLPHASGKGDRPALAAVASPFHTPPIIDSSSRRLASLAYQAGQRSEEHTSELQSLMRISYAVFCLKKKTNTKSHVNYHNKKHLQKQY